MIKWLSILCVVFFVFDVVIFSFIGMKEIQKKSVLGQQTPISTVPSAPATPEVTTAAASPTAQTAMAQVTKTLSKSSYSIALIGDSMVDTMGENLEYLSAELKNEYPNTKFTLYNYGIGAQNVSQGLSRFDSAFQNRERTYPPISQIGADVIIVGSFAYNPFATHDKNKHYTELTNIVQRAKGSAPHVYILAEISPLRSGFGDGPGGVNWPAQTSSEHVLKIIEQLENAQVVAKNLNVPLIDAMTKSRVTGKYGNPMYVSKHDGIHPSESGHAYMARLIVQTLKLQ